MSIKERLRQVIDVKGLTIKELSELCAIPYRSLQNYLRGEREPNADALVTLRTHLGISIDWLLTGNGSMFLDEKKIDVQQASNSSFSHSDLTLLELLNQLDPDVRRDLMRGAEDKQRMIEMEKKIEELSSKIAENKKTG
ncbi:TPA: helix-turn-helix transcriptional regulator [Serratia marcescens]|uniref:DNA-binding protein, Helix-turn-helix motif n=1 Tax=Serratia marcescens SM39 TaxID=1334564 RepID=A0AAT9F2C2_SERMA|nr:MULTISPECIES: helix-turn-helix transcriptional regulator [Serratia]HBY9741589.1 helix-turn-helix transcriptional regulator [Klebsiella pneumoniae]BAO32296.1 DNA-binding protein, Helix-turn-helix motif [Serratia marcescens SM39]BCZ39497.1 hypothetical protein SMGES_08230 [Serratia marcescens]HBI6266762.1 helix-turn-helix transcriptional regulator [Serratia marcescens]HBI6952273.1 helix-turn-helix transcriptional regulator [Serratia marcescens]